MSDPTFAEKDPRVIEAEAAAVYTSITGVTLAPADPRWLHLKGLLYIVIALRSTIDYAGKQNLLRYISDAWIDLFARLWGMERRAAIRATVTLRWTASTPGILVIPGGTRATDGTYLWEVVGDTDWTAGDTEGDVTSGAGASYVDTIARCTTYGAAPNDVPIGAINQIVDAVAGIASVSNTGESGGGAETETLEAFRTRIGAEPEAASVAGPREAYEALARAASADVEDAVALGPMDVDQISYDPPTAGEVHVLITEVGQDEPSAALLNAVDAYLTAETRRPLGDFVTVRAPKFVEYDIEFYYTIPRSRRNQIAEIQTAVAAAVEEYKLWQRAIGRDINPHKLIELVMAAGAGRLIITLPTYVGLFRDEAAVLDYEFVGYSGLEDG